MHGNKDLVTIDVAGKANNAMENVGSGKGGFGRPLQHSYNTLSSTLSE